jgi:hypothetical protein
MPKYLVSRTQTIVLHGIIEAESTQDAKDKLADVDGGLMVEGNDCESTDDVEGLADDFNLARYPLLNPNPTIPASFPLSAS